MIKSDTIERVILTATCFADADESIDIALILARHLKADMDAYLLQDEAMLLASQLPYSRATSLSGKSSKVTRSIMQEAFFEDAKSYQQALSQAASKDHVTWTFQQVEGTADKILTVARTKETLALFGFQRLHKPKNEILIIAPKISQQMTKLASLLSVKMKTHVEPLVVNGPEELRNLVIMLQKKSPALIIISDQIVREVGIGRIIDAGRCPIIVHAKMINGE